MQTIKEKITDLKATSKAKSEAKQEEKVEKDLAKSRADVAHEIRLAKEAEAAMDRHVNKAVEKAANYDAKLAEDKRSGHENDGLKNRHDAANEQRAADHSGGDKASNIPTHLSKYM
ncbi:Late embryogenesis abundant protein, LEA-25/LEA-D113 [Cynara cardunculus var. scolymus]|uniref:Late embryogenesis abundant protein, LEA-25/LEA-D113 n=1 Tax=Cynara cardunculus var. scolymus TaxID=59895 RepID=A0A103Y112_CYNCS|nr:Late embryogenesis abundant protein, LEA-25/LEA-D113 [Cynara cardunculus var. scolymus]